MIRQYTIYILIFCYLLKYLKNTRDIIKDYDIFDLIPLYQMCDNIVGLNTNIMKEEHENKKNSHSLICFEAFKIRKIQRLCHITTSRI